MATSLIWLSMIAAIWLWAFGILPVWIAILFGALGVFAVVLQTAWKDSERKRGAKEK